MRGVIVCFSMEKYLYDYLTRFRMDTAKQMLRNPSASVTDVVYAVGLSDPSYFTRVFRRYTGSCLFCYRDEQFSCTDQKSNGLRETVVYAA